MRELALFAGSGGGILGGHLLGWRTVCAVELDAYCRSVLLARPTGSNGAGTSMSSAVASRAKTSAVQAEEPGSAARRAGSGESLRASSEKSGPGTSSSKTLRTFALAGLSPSCKTLPIWGSMQNGECFELPTWERRTSEHACGFEAQILLPTPTTRGNEMSESMLKWPAHRRLAALMNRILPTPTARLYGNNRGGAAGRTGKTLTGGPWIAFREWMMGVPIGWNELEPLETARFQEWLNWHGRR